MGSKFDYKDEVIAHDHAKELFENCPSTTKVLISPPQMTHQYFEVEEHLIIPLKSLIARIDKERKSIINEEKTKKINIFDAPMLNIVKLMKNRKNNSISKNNSFTSISN